MSTSVSPAAQAAFRTLDVEGLAFYLKKSPLTVGNDLSRSPERLPPPIRTTGRKALWLEHKVLEWLEAQISQPTPAVKKLGRPTKVEQMARQAALEKKDGAA